MSAWACQRVEQDIDLSPATWPAGELEEFSRYDRAWGEPIPLAEGSRAMIAGTSSALAVRSGLEALKQGGSAVDAAMTHALADIVMLANCCVSHAGFMTMVYYEAATGEVHAMNAAWNTVKGEDDPASIPADTPSGRTALIPGFMAGVQAAHDRFGRLPFEALFQPAIYFADSGFVLNAVIAGMMAGRKDVLMRLPATREIFTNENGELYAEGDLYRQPKLAETLRRVAAEGASYMYTGEWGQKFADAVRSEGGSITLEDLRDYQVIWSEPAHTTYHGYDVYTLGLPNHGGLNIIEALNLAEAADVSGQGHYTTSAEALTRLIQIARVADVMGTSIWPMRQVPRELLSQHLGDIDLSPESRLTKETARRLWARMQEPAWTHLNEQAVGWTNGPGHSDAVVAVDEEGNVAAVLHTINTGLWGTTGINIDGVPITDAAKFQQLTMREAGPGNRLADPTDPLIVLRDGRPVLASSSIGVGLHEVTLQSVLNVLDFGMDPKTAGDTAQFLRPHGMLSETTKQAIPEGKFADDLVAAVRAKGQDLEIVPAGNSSWRGYWVGIRIDPLTGKLQGGTTRFFNGRALGY